MKTKTAETETINESETAQASVSPAPKTRTPDEWVGDRLGQIIGRDIGRRVVSGEEAKYAVGMEEKEDWMDVYRRLRTLDLNDSSKVVRFLRTHFGCDIGDLNDEEMSACVDAFVEVIDEGPRN